MPWLHIISLFGFVAGILMFGTSWWIRRRREINEGPPVRVDKRLMLGGAAIVMAFALLVVFTF